MAGPAAKQKMGASIGKGFFEETKVIYNDIGHWCNLLLCLS